MRGTDLNNKTGKILKNILSILLLLVVVITEINLPENLLSTRAAGSGIEIGLSNGFLTIVGDGDDTLTYEAFHFLVDGELFKSAKELKIEGVKTIGEGVFSGFDSIETIEISDDCKNIESNAFTDCGVTTLVLPDSIEKIGDRAFKDCSIVNLNIPDSVISIGVGAFCGNELESVVIGSGIKEIGASAFAGNDDLSMIEIKQTDVSVLDISEDAFQNIGNKVEIKVPEGLETEYKQKLSDGGISFANGGATIIDDPNPTVDPNPISGQNPPAPAPDPKPTLDPEYPSGGSFVVGPSSDKLTYVTILGEKAVYSETFTVQDGYGNEITLNLYSITQKDGSEVYGLINLIAKSRDSFRVLDDKDAESVKKAVAVYFSKLKGDRVRKVVANYYEAYLTVNSGPVDGKKEYVTTEGERAVFEENIDVKSKMGINATVALFVIDRGDGDKVYGVIDVGLQKMVTLGKEYPGNKTAVIDSIQKYLSKLSDDSFLTEIKRFFLSDNYIGPRKDDTVYILADGSSAKYVNNIKVLDLNKKEVSIRIYRRAIDSDNFEYGIINSKTNMMDDLGITEKGDLYCFEEELGRIIRKKTREEMAEYYGTVNTIYLPVEVANRKLDVKKMFPDSISEQKLVYRICGSNASETKKMKTIASVSKTGILTGKKTGNVTIEACKKLGTKKKVEYIPVYSIDVPIVKPQFCKNITIYTFPDYEYDAESYLTTSVVKLGSVSENTVKGEDLTGSILARCIEEAGNEIYWKRCETKVATIDDKGIITIGNKSGKFKFGLVIKDETGLEKCLLGSINVKVPQVMKKVVKMKQEGPKSNYKISLKNIEDYEYENITWESENTEIATVDNSGNITAVGIGTTKIVGTIHGMNLICTVKVGM